MNYYVVTSSNGAFYKFKNCELDIVENMPPQLFYKAKEDLKINDRATFYKPSQFAYLDTEERKNLYLKFQERVAAEYPHAFLVVPNQLVIIRKGLKHPQIGSVRPSYVTRLFQQE